MNDFKIKTVSGETIAQYNKQVGAYANDMLDAIKQLIEDAEWYGVPQEKLNKVRDFISEVELPDVPVTEKPDD